MSVHHEARRRDKRVVSGFDYFGRTLYKKQKVWAVYDGNDKRLCDCVSKSVAESIASALNKEGKRHE